MKSLLLLNLTFLFLLFETNVFAKKLNDRILFTIGSQAYSQYEMQAYLQVKLAVSNKPPVSFRNNYGELFHVFLDDMIMYSQSTKIFDASFNEKQKNNAIISKKISVHKTFSEPQLHLNLPQEKTQNILNIIQSIDLYKKTHNNKNSQGTWLKSLKQKTDFRIFKNATTYKPISILK